MALGQTYTEKGSSGTFITRGGAINPLTGTASAKSQDTIALESLQKELSFNRVKTQVQEEDQSKLRIEQRKAATASAAFQTRAGALEIEQRQAGLGREVSALKRSARQQQAQVLSGAAGFGNLGSSSSKAAQIASASNLKRETDYAGDTEGKAKKADIMREEQIAANLSATLLSLTDPTKVIQDADGKVFVNGKLTTAASQGKGIEGFKEAPTPDSPAVKPTKSVKKKAPTGIKYRNGKYNSFTLSKSMV